MGLRIQLHDPFYAEDLPVILQFKLLMNWRHFGCAYVLPNLMLLVFVLIHYEFAKRQMPNVLFKISQLCHFLGLFEILYRQNNAAISFQIFFPDTGLT